MGQHIKVIAGILFTMAIITMSGCRNKTAEKRISSGDISMTEVDSLQIHLDSLTTQSTSYLQLVGDSTIAFFNKPNSDIVWGSGVVPWQG